MIDYTHIIKIGNDFTEEHCKAKDGLDCFLLGNSIDGYELAFSCIKVRRKFKQQLRYFIALKKRQEGSIV